jgi:phage tail sheath protein FI
MVTTWAGWAGCGGSTIAAARAEKAAMPPAPRAILIGRASGFAFGVAAWLEARTGWFIAI